MSFLFVSLKTRSATILLKNRLIMMTANLDICIFWKEKNLVVAIKFVWILIFILKPDFKGYLYIVTLPQTVKNTNQFCCSYIYQQQKLIHTSIHVGISRCLHCVDRVNTEIKIGSKICNA